MNKKNLSVVILVLVALLSFNGCSEENITHTVKERVVKTITVKESSMADTIYYLGFIEPSEIKTYSLKTSGSVKTVNFKSGDHIEIGDILVTLDSYEYGLDVKASADQIALAEIELSKAIEARDFYKKSYNDALVLFEAGAISSQKVDEIKLQYDIKSKEVDQAVKVLNQAKIGSDVKKSSLGDTALLSDMDGFIVDVLTKEGELVAQGYPVAIARSDESVVKIGMAQNDVKEINVGDIAKVVVNGVNYSGVVYNINLMPDRLTKTYVVEISLEGGDFIIGESCKVYIELEKVKGIWINITDVMNDGVDYVFIVENGRATRKDIELHEINGSLVRVTNIEEGDQIIVSGKNALAEGYKVKVEGEKDE